MIRGREWSRSVVTRTTPAAASVAGSASPRLPALSKTAIENVAGRLGNTPTICRKCYIHPQILDCYLEGGLLLQVKDAVESELSEDLSSLRPEEAAVLGLLQARLSAAEDAVKAKGRVKPAGARGRGAKAPERSKSGTAAAKRASGARKAAAAA